MKKISESGFHGFNANHIQFNIHRMGLKLFLYESPNSFSLPDNIPPYLMESIDFNGFGVLVCCVSAKNSNRIIRQYQRILSIRYSRSLAYYLLENPYSFDVQKQKGAFPAIERVINFFNSKNYFKLYKDKYFFQGSDFLDQMENWNKFLGLPPQHLFLEVNRFETVKEQLEKDRNTNRRIDRDFFTSIPFNNPFILLAKVLVIYIKLLDPTPSSSKQELHSSLVPIRDFMQVWGDRTIILESSTTILANLVLFDYQNSFIKAIKEYFTENNLKCVIQHKIVDFLDQKTMINRYRNQYLLPDFSLFNPETLEYDIPFPTIKGLHKTFSSKH